MIIHDLLNLVIADELQMSHYTLAATLTTSPILCTAGVQQWSGTDSSPLGVQQRLHGSTDKNETWQQSLPCGRPSCMEQSTSSSSCSWQLVFV